MIEHVLVQEVRLVEEKTGWRRSRPRSSTWVETEKKRAAALAPLYPPHGMGHAAIA